MRPITREQKDNIHNALMVGMTLEDSYLYAGLTPEQIVSLDEDEEWQLHVKQLSKGHEYTLLNRMQEISQKQARAGREQATEWLLEKLYPRYSSKSQPEQLDIKLNLSGLDPLDPAHREDNIDVFVPTVINPHTTTDN